MSLMDQGHTPESLMDLALNFRLGGGFSVKDEVKLLFENLIGQAPNAGEATYYEGLVTSGSFTLNGLAWLAANSSYNTENIQLAGLMQTGLDYAL